MPLSYFASQLFIAAVPLIFSITLHEAAHGWVASKLGDCTAFMLGRVTLNPLKHIDPIGTILLPALMLMVSNFIFGFAKPVPVNWQQLRNPRRDMALVALAGPGANLLMALIWAAAARFALYTHPEQPTYLYLMAIFGIHINIFLMILNLLPIPPLDGSRVILSLLPRRLALYYNTLEPYGIWILLGLLMIGLLSTILFPPSFWLINWIKSLFHLPVY
jgi:Zn-dependent protease